MLWYLFDYYASSLSLCIQWSSWSRVSLNMKSGHKIRWDNRLLCIYYPYCCLSVFHKKVLQISGLENKLNKMYQTEFRRNVFKKWSFLKIRAFHRVALQDHIMTMLYPCLCIYLCVSVCAYISLSESFNSIITEAAVIKFIGIMCIKRRLPIPYFRRFYILPKKW